MTKQVLEQAVYEEMVKKMRMFQTLKGGRTASCNPKLTAARAALAKTESEIEKLLDTLVSQVRATSEQVVIHWKL